MRDEQAKVLRAIQPFTPEEVLTRTVRGQYGAGTSTASACPATAPKPHVAPRLAAPRRSSP